MDSSSILPASLPPVTCHPSWCCELGTRPRGLAMAREKGSLLAWDDRSLFLLNREGTLQAQRRTPNPIALACCADDGTCFVALGKEGIIWWLAPDLTERRLQSLTDLPVAAALDSFGQYLAIGDGRGKLRILD